MLAWNPSQKNINNLAPLLPQARPALRSASASDSGLGASNRGCAPQVSLASLECARNLGNKCKAGSFSSRSHLADRFPRVWIQAAAEGPRLVRSRSGLVLMARSDARVGRLTMMSEQRRHRRGFWEAPFVRSIDRSFVRSGGRSREGTGWWPFLTSSSVHQTDHWCLFLCSCSCSSSLTWRTGVTF